MKNLQLFYLVILICLYLNLTDSFIYDLKIATSNKTFDAINGKFELNLQSFSIQRSRNEPFIYSNTT